jgi:hypothetical protein
MSTLYTRDQEAIAPLLNPNYWSGNQLGRGDITNRVGPKLYGADIDHFSDLIHRYTLQGAPTQALSRIALNEEFDADAFPYGTVLISRAEALATQPDYVPMARFAGIKRPANKPHTDSGDQYLKGHGYLYSDRTLVSVVVGLGKKHKVGVLKKAIVTPDLKRKDAVPEIGVHRYTVGQTYRFDSKLGETLMRVNELVVVMNGMRPRSGRASRLRLGGFGIGASNRRHDSPDS